MTAATTCRILFQPIGKSVEIEATAVVLEALRKAGIDIAQACGGNGQCGQCRIIVARGEVFPPTAEELERLDAEEIAEGYRLACCTRVLSDLVVIVPRESLMTGNKLQIDGGSRHWPVAPLIQTQTILVPAPSLHDSRPDLRRVADVLKCDRLTADPPVIGRMTRLLRQNEWYVTTYRRGDELVGAAPPHRRPIGMAVDLGTTKIAAYLVDLAAGMELIADGVLNPQTRYGDDIMSRLNYASRSPENRELATIARGALNDLLRRMADKIGLPTEEVVDLCIVGNTGITHLLLDLPVHQLAVAPYVAATGAAMDIKARDLGIDAAPGAYVHILPTIGGFVGADHVAMIIGADIDHSQKVCLGVDIGTNTEIVLHNPHTGRMFSLSCPSGPAFEGAHVSSGMRAARGAIEAVQVTPEGVDLQTIENAAPIGLCGSGIIDAIAELSRHAVINKGGRFQAADSRVRKGRKGLEFLLSPGSRNGVEADIVINQKDVDEIQLAKGAINAGIAILLEQTGTDPQSIEEVIIAGAFGSYLSVESAIDIGLLPRFPRAEYRQVGNAAAAGAIQCLLSAHARRRALDIATRDQYIELTIHPNFSRRFARGMMFPVK